MALPGLSHRPTIARQSPLARAIKPASMTPMPASGLKGVINQNVQQGVFGGVPSWQDDPVLANIQAIQNQNIASAEASAAAQKKQQLIEYGYDPELEKEGLYDPTTLAAAKANPYSILANLAKAHEQNILGINTSAAKQGLGYSSFRDTTLGQEDYGYGGRRSGAATGLRTGLGRVADWLTQQLTAARSAEGSAETDAYNRYIASRQAAGFPGAPTVNTNLIRSLGRGKRGSLRGFI